MSARRDLNLFATMGLGGLWHGASLELRRVGPLPRRAAQRARTTARRRGWSLPRPLAVAVTFVLVVIGWVLFRMHSATGIGQVYAGMLGLHGIGELPGHLLAYIAVAAAVMFGLPEEWRWPVERWNAAWVAAAAVLFAVAASSVYISHPFIYFRF